MASQVFLDVYTQQTDSGTGYAFTQAGPLYFSVERIFASLGDFVVVLLFSSSELVFFSRCVLRAWSIYFLSRSCRCEDEIRTEFSSSGASMIIERFLRHNLLVVVLSGGRNLT
mmetsp:Transcript_2793/g.6111  ORF Transcript_2793/g.6111 Transcript_2793/m.6111 type:complete len:113 (-) Transcript_2793:626-964(-)